MTREQEITTMGAHAARPHEHRPATVARLAATTLTVAVTGVLGAGTALAHDGSGHDGGHGSHSGHSEHTVDGWDGDGARAEAEQAQETVRDVLADLGLSSEADDSGDSADWDGPADSHASPAEPEADRTADDGGSAAPPSGPRTTTQPIATETADRPTSEVPPAGQTQTFPIR